MDDQLELPTSIVPKDQQDEENGSSDEEGMPDWTNIPGIRGLSRAVIPKRGEKEFEPAAGGATALQSHVLSKSRNAMFDALRGSRGASRIARAHVLVARGTHFSMLGHSAVRQTNLTNVESNKPQKRLELMPEEALYLMERGSLFCWRESEAPDALSTHLNDTPDLEDCDLSYGAPMTMQQAFAEMIGKEELSLQCYIVHSARKTPIPDIHQLSELFASVEPRPPPPPRKRGPPNAKAGVSQQKSSIQKQIQDKPASIWDRMRRAFGFQPPQAPPTQTPNPFVHLKAGRKSVIVAAVDGSMTHLVRFGEGDFASWPMV
ncbi:tRNA-splicing endonuclease subunit sen54 [Ceratobasidium sp. 392]|nr:tRNA-splicing endonuclease subunit sen54 [Ceratobasidium sp. 392]